MDNALFVLEVETPALIEQSSLYNHVGHVDSVRLLETAREKFLEKHGLTLKSLIDNDIFLVVTCVNAEFLREVKGDKCYVTVDSYQVVRKRIIVKQSIYNESKKEAVSAEVHLACLSKVQQRAVQVPQELVSLGSI